MFNDVVVRMQIKILIHINGFYFPCPTTEQSKATHNLIDHDDANPRPGFSVYVISTGTSANRHCGFSGPVEKDGSCSIVYSVHLKNGIAQSYEEIQKSISESS